MVTGPPNGVDVFAQFNNKAVYQDNVQSWATVEPATDARALRDQGMSYRDIAKVMGISKSAVPLLLNNQPSQS
jgi:DNA invertase Pin-like site-specific DNA recombinase